MGNSNSCQTTVLGYALRSEVAKCHSNDTHLLMNRNIISHTAMYNMMISNWPKMVTFEDVFILSAITTFASFLLLKLILQKQKNQPAQTTKQWICWLVLPVFCF